MTPQLAAPTLRPYQRDALAAVSAARERGKNRVLMQQPTGCGKTVCFAAMPTWPAIAGFLASFPKGDRGMLVIAHREELLDQATDKIQRANPDLYVSIEQANRYAHSYSDVVVASIQTLEKSKFRRLKALIAKRTFRLVIVDEAHHAAASTYRTALTLLGFLPPADASEAQNIEAPTFDDVAKMETALDGWDARAPQDRLLVGVTATPNRSDAVGLGCVFQEIAYAYSLKQAIDDGWLAPIVPWVVETQTNLDSVRMTAGEFNQKQLAEIVNTDIRNQLAVAGWLEHAADRPTLAFTVDVAHAHALADEFARNGITALAVSGETPKEDRRQALAAYTAGRVQVITNCAVFTEGVDLPLTSCVLMAKPTRSATLYAQCVGRGLRQHKGKLDCIVIDVVDVARRHSLLTTGVLYGLPPNLVAVGKKLQETAREWDEFTAKNPGVNIDQAGRKTLAELNAIASTFSVWEVRPLEAAGAGLAMNWIRTGDDAYRLQYPWGDGEHEVEVLLVQKDLLGKFSLHVARQGGEDPIAPKVMAHGVSDANACLHLAEAFIRQERQRVTKLVDTSAPWRARPASPKQIAYLRRMRVQFREPLTMGQASELLDMAKARSGA